MVLPPSVTRSMPMPMLDRDCRAEGAAGQVRPAAERRGRRRPGAVGFASAPVEIDLPARQHAVEARLLAEPEIGGAGELEALLLRAVLKFDLLHQRRRRGRLDLAAETPGLLTAAPPAAR